MKRSNLLLVFGLLLFFIGLGLVNAQAVIDNPLDVPDVITLINRIFDALLTIAEVVLGFIIVLSGVKMITSGGKPEEMTKARAAIFNAAIGIVVLLSAKAIWVFIDDALNP